MAVVKHAKPAGPSGAGGTVFDLRLGDPLGDGVTRLESLKAKLLRLPGLNERERTVIFRDLDALRGLLVQSSTRAHVGPQRLAVRSAEATRLTIDDLKIEGILGQTPRIQKLLRIIAKIASTDLTILMEGETGSGKELFARIIHDNSKRSNFVAVNCGAFPSGIIESELFGHVKGAFTGATHERKGKFEEADGGNIFLDEIGELEMSAQVKLLRAVQEGELQRVGSDKTYKVDVRVIAATNRNLEEMVGEKIFREDLYHRINMCPLIIPPLRERRDEIRILLDYFFQGICPRLAKPEPTLGRALQKFLYENYEFPGNIRELKNLAHYLASIADGEPLTLDDLPDRYEDRVTATNASVTPVIGKRLDSARDAAERSYIIDELERSKGRIKAVCAATGLSRSRVYQLLKKYKIDAARYRR